MTIEIMTTETDEILALEYLYCRAFRRNGVTELAYVEPGTDRETECLAALGRLLRGGEELSMMLRWKLAALLNPAEDSVEARRLVMVRRRAGGKNHPSDARDMGIAVLVAAAVNAGGKIEYGIALAMERYGVSERTVTRAWKAHRSVWLAKDDSECQNPP